MARYCTAASSKRIKVTHETALQRMTQPKLSANAKSFTNVIGLFTGRAERFKKALGEGVCSITWLKVAVPSLRVREGLDHTERSLTLNMFHQWMGSETMTVCVSSSIQFSCT